MYIVSDNEELNKARELREHHLERCIVRGTASDSELLNEARES